MNDSKTKPTQPMRSWPIFAESESGRLCYSHTEHVHESRECVNCHALCENANDDGESITFCTVLDEFVPGGEYFCLEHQTLGEHKFGLKRSGVPIDAPSPSGSSAAWLNALAWMENVVKTKGEAALYLAENDIKFARLMLIAPDDYYHALETVAPGLAEEWRNWARGRVERHDYPEFFELLQKVGDIRRAEGEEAPHRPEHAGLFVRMMKVAPPCYRREANATADQAGLIPKATHVNDEGVPVFSLDQLADHLDVPVDELQAFADEHIDADAKYRGALHVIH